MAEFEVIYDETRDSGEPGVTPMPAGVRVDVQTGAMRRSSRSPVFVRTERIANHPGTEKTFAFRCTATQAREIASALNTAADLVDGHAV